MPSDSENLVIPEVDPNKDVSVDLEIRNGGLIREVSLCSVPDLSPSVLSFTPAQAPTFGGQSIFLSFISAGTPPLKEGTFYYVMFEGSKQRHLTSAKILNPYTLQAVIPDHDEAELVIMTVCHSRDSAAPVTLAKDTFVFTSDPAEFLAQQLALNACNPEALLGLEEIYFSLLDIPLEEKKALDLKMAAAFRRLKLPDGWTLSSDAACSEGNAQWTLLHFCAKYGFPVLAELLLNMRGAIAALGALDVNGLAPFDLASRSNHRQLTEILSRVPCEEASAGASFAENKPSVKRHKLGTTTISTCIQEDPSKNIRLLEELDALAAASQEIPDSDAEIIDEDSAPLAESLKKLQEINTEIRRLRGLSYKEDLDECFPIAEDKEGEKELEGVFYSAEEDEEVIPGLKDGTSKTDSEGMVGTAAEEAFCVTERRPSGEIKTLIANKIDQHVAAEEFHVVSEVIVEHVPAEVAAPADGGSDPHQIPVDAGAQVQPTSLSDSAEAPAQSGELKMNLLECVLEETEEQLKAEGVNRSPSVRKALQIKPAVSMAAAREMVIPELPIATVLRRPGILKRIGKDRPLSDSFENLKRVETETIRHLIGENEEELENLTPRKKLPRSHSLDSLLHEVVVVPDRDSQPSSQSQLSVPHGSVESLSDCESPNPRLRSASDKMLYHPNRSSSQLSLDERHSRYSLSSQEDLARMARKASLFNKISFKKAKSMTSIEIKGKYIAEVEERRRTVSGAVEVGVLPPTAASAAAAAVAREPPLAPGIVCCSPEGESTKSLSTESLNLKDKSSFGRALVEPSDEDTDEGTCLEIAEGKVRKNSGGSTDERKRLFGILRAKPKDKKEAKVKDKDKKDKENDAKDKNHKKIAKLKNDFSVPLPPKPDVISGFLSKRGSSFRQNLKMGDKTAVDKQAFQRSSTVSAGTGSAFAKLRGSDRGPKSPSNGRKSSSDGSDKKLTESQSEPEMRTLSLTQNLSTSRTSLDSLSNFAEEDSVEPLNINDDQYDSDLDAVDAPETWSEFVDKRVQRKMHAKDIKRQDVIYELIQTESAYVRTLNVMRKIYATSMIRDLDMDIEIVKRIFPGLDDLIELNGGMLQKMKKRQAESSNLCIENIGDILIETFGGENGEQMKEVYGEFCSQHLEAVELYKELLKADKKFAFVMRKWMLNERVRRLSIPECITYVTIRMTKYPLLIEAIIKATKESKPDYNDLKDALKLVKECLVAVDRHVEQYEQRKELEKLKRSLDRKSVVKLSSDHGTLEYRTTKLFHKRSRLLYDRNVSIRGKNRLFESRMVVLAEKIIFFQENGGKFALLSVDQKAPVISLKNLMVREVATDNKALFLVSTSKDAAQIYEVVMDSYKEKKEWLQKINDAVKDCPEEEEENMSDLEEEMKREEEERIAKLREIVASLQDADEKVSSLIAGKNRLVVEMRELIEAMDKTTIPTTELKPPDVLKAREALEAALMEANSLSTLLASNTEQTSGSPTPSPGVSTSSINNPSLVIKKSETFGSFEQRLRQPVVPANVKRATSMQHDMKAIAKSAVLETDSGPGKPRRQSQLLSVLGRNKTLGSQEDIASLSSASSASSSNMSAGAVQLVALQALKDSLTSLVDITNKQDLELGKMRLDLQDARADVARLSTEKKELEDRLTAQQKDHEKQMSKANDLYAKLQREFKRTVDKLNRQLMEQGVGQVRPPLQKPTVANLIPRSNSNNAMRKGSTGNRPHEDGVDVNGGSGGLGSQNEVDGNQVIFF